MPTESTVQGPERVDADAERASARRSVIELMARIVAGDTAAIFEMATVHHGRIAAVLRSYLRAAGIHAIEPAELDGLVLDSCHALADIAAAWRPDGAFPWHWGRARLGNLVHGWIGVHADSLDASVFTVADDGIAAACEEEAMAETYRRLVDEVPVVGELARAATAARVSESALLVFLDYRVQQDQGDPSPSHTLAERYGVSPDAIRQRVSRTRRRIGAVVDLDDEFDALRSLALFVA